MKYIQNPQKLIVALVAMLAVTALAVTHAVSGDLAVGVITSVLAYILGNGVAAAQGKPVLPILGKSEAVPAEPGD